MDAYLVRWCDLLSTIGFCVGVAAIPGFSVVLFVDAPLCVLVCGMDFSVDSKREGAKAKGASIGEGTPGAGAKRRRGTLEINHFCCITPNVCLMKDHLCRV